MIIVDCRQNTPEWDALRLDNPGASGASRIIKPNGEQSGSFNKYVIEMADNIIDGKAEDTYYSRDMQKGHEREQESRSDWESDNDIEIQQVGLIFKDENRYCHISPDGIMPDIKWGFETKNAKASVQYGRLKKQTVEGAHWIQCQMSLFVTSYECWVYQSYCRGMETLTINVYPDLEFIKKLEAGLMNFIGQVRNLVKEYRRAG